VNGEPSHQAQQCRKCLKSEYILEPNEGHECQPCPVGLTCNGDSSYTETVKGSHWVREGQILKLVSCPVGYLFVNSSNQQFVPDLQECKACEPLTYSLDPFDGCTRNSKGQFFCATGYKLPPYVIGHAYAACRRNAAALFSARAP
jgi:hypothetical protein